MGENLITVLAKELRMRGVEQETTFNITLMVRREQHAKKIIDWLRNNEMATSHEIRKAAREIVESTDYALRVVNRNQHRKSVHPKMNAL